MSYPYCEIPKNVEKTWLYDEYYIGQKDNEERKSGHGEYHWSGPKSLEWYNGHFLRDTMHGPGEYRWRHLGQEGVHFTYEGCFYCNRMHGFGTMSYPDGKVFTGLFHSNIRWGPGIESQACLKQDVGLWRGTQLVRLAWRPLTPSVAPDLCANSWGRANVDPHRVMLSTRFKTIGETNSAIDLLKQRGSDPMSATERWERLYPRNCTDLASLLCHVTVFERDYYKEKIHLLEEVANVSSKDPTQDDEEVSLEMLTYFAWNNNRAMVHMMKHSYTHDKQRNTSKVSLTDILSGPRNQFRPAGKHEIHCRTLLMACFLGHVPNVTHLVNGQGVHPDVADSLGNTAVMYATCGDHADLIHFLVEAGANVDSYNDSCCTPLGVALLRLACVQKDIYPSGMVQAALPPPIIPAPRPVEPNVFEWHIVRYQPIAIASNGLTKVPSKISKSVSVKKIKSVHSLKDLAGGRRKTEMVSAKLPTEDTSVQSFTEFSRLYQNIHNEFLIRVNDIYFRPSGISPIPYLFEVNDMVKEIELFDDDPKKLPDKAPKKVPSKLQKIATKPSRDTMWQTADKDDSSIDSVEKQKLEMKGRIMLSILQLLEDGANPKLVRCPQPALFIAIASGCSSLVKHLVNYGADINEVYHEAFGYTPLDLAISRPLSYENLELIKSILECGGQPNHRLTRNGEVSSLDSIPQEWYGPTLYHAVLARKTENETQDELQLNLLELLLDYNCHPSVQFKGRSAVDLAMTKNMATLEVFINSPITNLNANINDANQTILVKMFYLPFFRAVPSADRLQILTNLLLFGADPLLECRNGDESFRNLFEYTKKVLTELEKSQMKPTPAASSNKADSKKKEKQKPKKEQLVTKSTGKMAVDDVADYKQAVDLVVECARMLHVRWLQAKLMKEIVVIIDKYKHRQWNMIMKEHKRKKSARLWLTAERCLEIWDIMKATKRKIYNDNRILKHLLYIMSYYNSKNKVVATTKLTAEEKYFIECKVSRMLKERKESSKLSTDMVAWKRSYVQPELTSRADERKFNVCFECVLPLEEEKIECVSCKLVSFCCLECMKTNIDRGNCHPCNEYLKQKYFPSPSESENIVF